MRTEGTGILSGGTRQMMKRNRRVMEIVGQKRLALRASLLDADVFHLFKPKCIFRQWVLHPTNCCPRECFVTSVNVKFQTRATSVGERETCKDLPCEHVN
mmetsp:Transcript_6996/g.15950  ORF Transcript_6996/g.15950 Transcript_6996/m.15950 type:complete len:100 (-) Transcript_6996:36-335(-)